MSKHCPKHVIPIVDCDVCIKKLIDEGVYELNQRLDREAEKSMWRQPNNEGYFSSVFAIPVMKPSAPKSWVKDSVSPKDMLQELRKRPHSRFPEIEEFHGRNHGYCTCDECYSLRRRLITDLVNQGCENR